MLERVAAAWRALVGTPEAATVEVRGLLSDGVGSPGDILASVRQYGTYPIRGSQENLRSYRKVPRYRAALDRIAGEVASANWRAFRPVNQRGQRALELAQVHGWGTSKGHAFVTKAVQDHDVEVLPDHPIVDLLDTWNPALTAYSSWRVCENHLDMVGEAFLVVERMGGREPRELWPVVPTWVRSTPTVGDPTFRVVRGSFDRRYSEDDVIWVRNADPADPYGRGAGIGETLGDEIDTDESAAKHAKSLFANHAMPSAIAAVKGAGNDAVKRAQKRWDDAHRGPNRSGRIHWTAGEVELRELTQDLKSSQFVELREFERDAIVQTFGVPPEILGIIENSNRATIEAATFIFTRFVIVPRLELWRTELQQKLVDIYWPGVWLGYDSPVPADREFQLEAMKAAPEMPTVNEWREVQGLPADDINGELHAVEGNLGFALDLTEIPPPALAAPPADSERSASAVGKAMTLQDVDLVIETLDDDDITRLTEPRVQSIIEEWGAGAIRETGADVEFTPQTFAAAQHLREHGTRMVTFVGETTKSALRLSLSEGVSRGESIDELSARVSGVMDTAARSRARLIARTETGRSVNFARVEGFQQSGLVQRHKWLATADTGKSDGNRPHFQSKLHGQIRRLGEPFRVDGKSALHPGAFTDVGENANCRCVTIPVIEDESAAGDVVERQSLVEAVAEASAHTRLVGRMRVWEARMQRDVRAGFNAQRDSLIAEINRRFGA